MATARERARDAVVSVRIQQGRATAGDYDLADAASDVWEPIVRDLMQSLEVYDRPSQIDPALRRSIAQDRRHALQRAREALGDG